MKYDFDTRVDRKNRGNLKELMFTPDAVRKKGVVCFSGAEFEFKTARPVIDAVKEAAENGLFGFTVADQNYYDHILWWMKNVRGVTLEKDWILPVQGTIFSAATSIRLFTEKGEGIIVPTPGYNRYEQAARRLGRKTTFVPVRSDCSLDLAELEKAMQSPSNKLLFLCNPNNPTGKIISRETLREILALARRYGTAVWCDEIFADVDLTGKGVPMLADLAEENDCVISVFSMGKTFSFTGVNHAHVVIKNAALREKYQAQRDADHFGSIDPMAYAALYGGYTPEGKEWLEEMISVIQSNNETVASFFAEHMPAVKVNQPEAGYVLWLDFTGLGLTEEELFRFLSEEAYFCCDPGKEYYGAPCMARMCTAVPSAELERCLSLLLDAARARGLA